MLRTYIPAGPSGQPATELKISLGTKDASSPEFHARYGQALARFESIVAQAVKLASGTYDALDAPTIAPLAAPAPVRPRVPLLATFDAYAAAALKPLTAQDWRRCIVHLVAFLGNDDAAKLTTEDLMRWRNQLLTEPSKKGGLRQPGTVRGKYIGSVKAMLNWAVDEQMLPANVALAVTVRGKKKPGLRGQDFTDAEADRILSATLEPAPSRLAAGYVLARRWIPWLCAYTGARVQEIAQLRKEDVAEIDGSGLSTSHPRPGQ